MHDFHGAFRALLHAANLRHGTDGFTSPPKEGVLRIFLISIKMKKKIKEAINWQRPQPDHIYLLCNNVLEDDIDVAVQNGHYHAFYKTMKRK